jgi:hypothetical protein
LGKQHPDEIVMRIAIAQKNRRAYNFLGFRLQGRQLFREGWRFFAGLGG